MPAPRYRQLLPGQRSAVMIGFVDGREPIEIYRNHDMVVEAPTWHPQTDDLIVNAEGSLWRIPAVGDKAERLVIPGLPEVNNDHVLHGPSGIIYASAIDGHIYEVPIDGEPAKRLTNDRTGEGALFMHFLHGVSSDGTSLAYTGLQFKKIPTSAEDAIPEIQDIFRLTLGSGRDERLTFGPGVSDGSEYSPDGSHIYFNTEMFSGRSGNMQVARMAADGSNAEQLTFDDNVNWFPHLSPSGEKVVYLSYPEETQGHPADVWVEIKLVEDRWDKPRTVARLFGGQGTINVNSWAPDGTRFAYVAYPVSD